MKLAARTFRRTDYTITSKFGPRGKVNGVSNTSNVHKGCDYGTHGEKWKIYALEDGIVIRSNKDNAGANVVVVKYPRLGIEVGYWHLDKRNVKVGEYVNENTVLGTVGKTGKANGIHLHMQVNKIGSKTYIDPEKYNYKPYVKEGWLPGKYKILVDKYMRKSTDVVKTNLVKYNSLSDVTKKQCKNKNGYAQFKVGAKITVSNIIYKKGLVWGEYANTKKYLVLCNKDGTPQARREVM